MCYVFSSFVNTTQFLNWLSDILRQRPKDDNMKKYCVSVLEKLGSFDYTIKTLKALEERYSLGFKSL